MKCPKCQSDRMNYSMTRDRKGIMHSYAECQNCRTRWEREMVTQSNPQTSIETQYEDKTSSEHGDTALRIATIIFVLFIIAVNILSFSFLPKAGLGLLVILIFIISLLLIGFVILMWSPLKVQKSIDVKGDMTGLEYEVHVATKLRNEGYTDVTVTKASGDHGADILAVTPMGITAVIQCKFYKGAVGQEAVQQAVSAREYYRRSQAIVITNSTFTPAAEDFARHTNTILIEKYI